MYHIAIFKVPHHPLQSTTSPSLKYHTTFFKVPHRHFQSTTPPSSKYRTTLFKVQHHPLQSTTKTFKTWLRIFDSVRPARSRERLPLYDALRYNVLKSMIGTDISVGRTTAERYEEQRKKHETEDGTTIQVNGKYGWISFLSYLYNNDL